MGVTALSTASTVALLVVPLGRALAHATLDTQGRATRFPATSEFES
jgi:hypothetical protein